MKEVILAGIKSGHRPGKKALKKTYTFTGAKQKTAASALKVMGALNALNHMLTSIGGYARKIVFDNIVPQWLRDVASGDKEMGAFTVTTDDAKALIVPMKKYAAINDQRAAAIFDLKDKYGIDIDIEEVRHFEFNQKLVDLIPEEKMDDLITELKAALLKSSIVPAKVKTDIRSGKIPIIQEETQYEYGEDILTNLPKLSEGDPKKAKAIVDAVKPVFAVRSFEMDDKEVQVAQALDLIKENMDAMPETEK